MVSEDVSFYIEIILMAFAILSMVAILTSYTWVLRNICCPAKISQSKKRAKAKTIPKFLEVHKKCKCIIL